MEYGVQLPHIGRQAGRDTLIGFAQKAEALGFHSGWVSDHIALPVQVASRYPYSDTGDFPAQPEMPWLDPLGTLLFVAACTERLRLGTTVLILGYRPPVQTAKLLTTLDVLSGGRLILGVGVGWMREEFEALGMPFDHRGARADEQLELFEALFTRRLPSFDGRFYRFPPLGFEPRPISGRIPIWVGGTTEAAFRRAARYGDGFHAAFQSIDAVRQDWSRVRELAEKGGRDPGALQLSVRAFLDFENVADPSKSLHGSPEQMVDLIGRYQEVGVSCLVLDIVARGSVSGREEAMERFAHDVMRRTPASGTVGSTGV